MSIWTFEPTVDGKVVLDTADKPVSVSVEVSDDVESVEIKTIVDGEVLESNYLLPDKLYDVLKWVALLLLPTCAWLITALSDVWGIPMAEQISMTLNIIGTFIAALIGISAIQNAR